ncbi:NAD(P)/FAD-dependent oxidoreductase [Neobacillus sp. NPDC097160]|uniref:NAD(P)/FAD-dependent oxidoreductase n=1 Tax=Neobacillus sp. NPDC097160 TaxID=3364298 RepID=UPI0037FB098E
MANKHDIIIVGGGIMSASLAYHLLKDGFTGDIAIFEKDPQYEFSSTPRSEGGIRQTFSTEINIRMSQYSFHMYKKFEEEMAIDGEQALIDFKQHGYLYLLNDKTLPTYKEIMNIQRKLGVNAILMPPEEIKDYIPELNVADLAGAVFDPDAGNIDPYSVLQAYVRKAKRLGAKYIYEEVDCLLSEGDQITGIQLKSGEKHDAPIVVNACGAWSGELSQTIGIEIPVRPLRRQVFCIDLAKRFIKELPFTFDPTGIHFRSEGSKVIVGWGNDVPFGYDFHWERSYFEEEIWPLLAERSANFEQLKLERGWAGLYDYNYIDQNGIISGHPKMRGYYIATGFSGHGFQQAPAVGKGLSELIRLGKFETIDMSALSIERFEKNELVLEMAVF